MKTFSNFLLERNLNTRELLFQLSNVMIQDMIENISRYYTLRIREEMKERYQDVLAALVIPEKSIKESIESVSSEEYFTHLSSKVDRPLTVVFTHARSYTLNNREHYNPNYNSIQLFAEKDNKHAVISAIQRSRSIMVHELGHYYQTTYHTYTDSVPSAVAHDAQFNKNDDSAYTARYLFDDEELDAELFAFKHILNKDVEVPRTYSEYLKAIQDHPYFQRYHDIIEYLIHPHEFSSQWQKLYRKMALRMDKVFKYSFHHS
jgi:hypothetical protein